MNITRHNKHSSALPTADSSAKTDKPLGGKELPKATIQGRKEALLRHARTQSDVLFPVTSSFSLLSPVSPASPKVSAAPSLLAKVSLLETTNFQLEVDLAHTRKQNAELQTVIQTYEKKVAVLLNRTTDCMDRVIKTKNVEIARLETSLSVKEDQFAAKLEAEVRKQRELECSASFATAADMKKRLIRLKEENRKLKEEIARLKAKADMLPPSSPSRHYSLPISHLSRSPPQDNLNLLCYQITHLHRLIEALRKGDLTEALTSLKEVPDHSRDSDFEELVERGKRELEEIEKQVLAWCSSLCGGHCNVS